MHAFDAATLGGAARARPRRPRPHRAGRKRRPRALEGRARGAMTPLRDPIKNIVYNATAEDVDRVYVDGRLVVDGGRVLAADERAILAALQAAGERMCGRACGSSTGPIAAPTSLAPDLPRVDVSRAARVGPRRESRW